MSDTDQLDHPADPDTARRAARIEWLAGHRPGDLAAMLVETEARVAALEREQLAREVAALAGAPAPSPRGAADQRAVIDGYAAAVRERDQLRRERDLADFALSIDTVAGHQPAAGRTAHGHQLALAQLCAALDDLVARGRRGELSMIGLVPVTALVELLDAHRPQNAAPGEPSPYRASTGTDRPGPDPETTPVPPERAR